jgi:hypothetical protein|tara:strand:- start:184 stop:378 length:195 start_codon:yes stop_codon:yes gene_type:complete
MNVKEELDWLISDGANGLEILLFLLRYDTTIQSLIGIGVLFVLVCWYFDKKDDKDTKWDIDPHG